MSGNRGFMLLEVVIAIVVLSILVIPFSMSLVAAVRQSESAEKRLIALQLAQGKLEEITAEMTDTDYHYIGPLAENFADPYHSFSFKVKVSKDPKYNLMQRIKVTVYYTESDSEVEKTVTVTGALTKKSGTHG